MNKMSDNVAVPGSDAVEALLEKAAPRPAPPDNAEHDVREAVRAEWAVTTKRRRRRRVTTGFAVAATVTLALAFSLASLRQTGVAPAEVASIDRSAGTLYVQSSSSAPLEAVDTNTLVSGQVLTTGADSAAGLTWLNGGSLRIAANTRIEFKAADKVFLHSGKIYFDSFGAITGSGLTIESAHGVVSHVGTQYITESNAASLIVSVREGEVAIEGTYHDQTVFEGQRVEMTGSARPSVTNTSGIGSEWEWVETVSPRISVDGMTIYEFLHWVGRETGYTVRFESEAAETLAKRDRFGGVVSADPRTELRLRMMTVDLEARFDAEATAIVVTD
jgi:ferric-dicitrate binding protein FerR (iron transport regulator)